MNILHAGFCQNSARRRCLCWKGPRNVLRVGWVESGVLSAAALELRGGQAPALHPRLTHSECTHPAGVALGSELLAGTPWAPGQSPSAVREAGPSTLLKLRPPGCCAVEPRRLARRFACVCCVAWGLQERFQACCESPRDSRHGIGGSVAGGMLRERAVQHASSAGLEMAEPVRRLRVLRNIALRGTARVPEPGAFTCVLVDTGAGRWTSTGVVRSGDLATILWIFRLWGTRALISCVFAALLSRCCRVLGRVRGVLIRARV